jgi:hypothetical protein
MLSLIHCESLIFAFIVILDDDVELLSGFSFCNGLVMLVENVLVVKKWSAFIELLTKFTGVLACTGFLLMHLLSLSALKDGLEMLEK